MTEKSSSIQLAVVGGGPGGYAAAFLAADLGMQVALIDVEPNPGGICLYRGCIPSKALLHAAKVLNEARHAANWGITFAPPKIDIDKLRAWKDSVVRKHTGGLGQLAKSRSVHYIQGYASLLDARTLRVEKKDGEPEKLSFEHIILATGSRPATLPGFPKDSKRIWDSTSALELPSVPKTMLVVGGGYIGLELGTVYAALGTEVSVVEMMPGLLPGVDRDLVTPLAKRLEKTFRAIMLNTKVGSSERRERMACASNSRVKPRPPRSRYTKPCSSPSAASRTPPSSAWRRRRWKSTRAASSKSTASGAPRSRTIFAIGDVAGEPMLAHKASHEGRVGRRGHRRPQGGLRAASDSRRRLHRSRNRLVRTDRDPGARKKTAPSKSSAIPWAASGRATTSTATTASPSSSSIRKRNGFSASASRASDAGEMIAEGVLAVEMAATAADLTLTIHPHPTLSETVMEAAEVFFGQSTHLYRPKKK